MIVTCEMCSTSFNLSDELIKPSGSKVRCSKCKKVFSVYPPIAEEPSLELPTETSDINLGFSTVPPIFDFSQLDEQEAQKITPSDHSSEALSSPKEYLDITEYDFTEIDKLIQLDKPDNAGTDKLGTDNDLLFFPGDIAPEPSLSVIEPLVAQFPSEEPDNLLEIDLSDISLDQSVFMDLMDDLDSDLITPPSDQSIEKQLTGMYMALQTKTESFESKPLEAPLGEFEKSLEMDLGAVSLLSPSDEETSYNLEMDIAETKNKKSQETESDLFLEDDLNGFNDVEDMDLSDIETLLEEQDASKYIASLADGAGKLKRSDSVIVPAVSATETDKTVEMEEQFLTFDELQLDKDESESATLLEVKESFSPAIEIPEPPSAPLRQKEPVVKKTEVVAEEKPSSTDTVIEEEPEEAPTAPKKGISPLIIAALILAVIAGLGYGGYILLNSMGIPIPFSSKPAPSKVQDPGNFKIKPFDISSKFVDNSKIGKLFIITGKVKNEYPAARGSIQVVGKLYTKDKAIAKEEAVFCGNILSDIDLASADPATIQERLQNRSGDNGANLKLAPGDVISFMIVFSNLPDNLEEFTLEVKASVAK